MKTKKCDKGYNKFNKQQEKINLEEEKASNCGANFVLEQ